MNTTSCVNSELTASAAAGPCELPRSYGVRSTTSALYSMLKAAYHQRLSRMSVWHQQRIDRQAFETMLSLEDELLKDIGVTRDAVRWAAQLPLEQDAALALRKSMKGSGCDGLR